MLELKIADTKLWDEKNEEFIYIKGRTIVLEHSLVSLTKWEAKYKKPFLATKMTNEECLDYIQMMTITQNVDPLIYKALTEKEIAIINEYISDPMTATKFYENGVKKEGQVAQSKSTEKITSELIYYWMLTLNIPPDPFQKWHLNKLLVLIRICRIENAKEGGAKGSKMSRRDVIAQNRALNAARRQRLGSHG